MLIGPIVLYLYYLPGCPLKSLGTPLVNGRMRSEIHREGDMSVRKCACADLQRCVMGYSIVCKYFAYI